MILATERLLLRQLTVDDAPFMLELLNDPSFVRFIGDRGVRTLDAAGQYIRDRIAASYERFGFGLYLAELAESGLPVGICGLVKRDELDDVDLGYALLPGFRGRGYALEAAGAMLHYARTHLVLQRIVAITSADNDRSVHVLEQLGFVHERMVRLSENVPDIRLFMPRADPRSCPLRLRSADREVAASPDVEPA
jgi:RimJ/RimL family protein N-acetyltransferase